MRRLLPRFLVIAISCLAVTLSFAQQRTVSGVVNDSTGKPLGGVSYIVSGSKLAGATNEQGRFSIQMPNNASITFSFVGYEPKTVRPGNSSTINISLTPVAGGLEDVIVTALGVKRDRRSVGYSIASVKGEELTKAGATMNPFLALYGKASGVGVNVGAAGPMGGLKLNIRGSASLNSEQNLRPLFVIDGVIISDRATSIGGSVGSGYDYGSNINDINSEDIESIDILKGAKATVLYGTDAANGVVLITTKSGRNVKGFGMSGSFQYSVEKPRAYLDLQKEYGLGDNIYDTTYLVRNGQRIRQINNKRFSFGPKFDGANVVGYDSILTTNSPHDSYKDLFQTGTSFNSNVAIAGSSDKGSIRASYTNYRYNDITSSNSWQKRNTFSFSGNIKASKLASFELVTNIYNIVSQNRREGNGGSIAWGFPVDYDYHSLYNNLYLDNTGYQRDLSNAISNTGVANIGGYLWSYDRNRQKDDKFHVINSAKVTLNFTKHIFFTGQFGLDYDNTTYTTENSVTRIVPVVANGSFGVKKENNTVQTYQGLLNYDKGFKNDDIHVSAFGGFIYRLRNSEILGSNSIGGLNFPGWYSFNNEAGVASSGNLYQIRSYGRGSDVLYSVVASGTVSWKNELYLEIQGRQDWNSTLPPANNKNFYPDPSLPRNYTEHFSIPKMNRGQIRFAWADVGSGTNRYFANNQYSIGYLTGTGVSATSITPPGSLLPGSLKPERKREFEVGINHSFFNQNRLTLDLSFYTNNKYDEIIGLPVSASSSSSSLKINAANMRTWGFEFSVMGSPVVTKDLRWNITLNGARQGSKVLGLYSDLQAYTYGNLINNNSGAASIRADVGHPFGEIKMYDFLRDDNGNKVVTNGLYSLDAQKTIIAGNIMPKLYGGILSDLRYKSFNFRIGLDYKSGGTVFSYTNMRMTGLGQLSSTLQYRDEQHGGMAYYIDATGKKIAWQHNVAAPAGAVGGRVYHDGLILPGTKLDATNHYITNDVITSATSYYEFYANDLASSFPPDRLYKNNYVKVREVALAYTLPVKMATRLSLQAVTVTLAARNLFYIYKSIPNIDVEAATGADGYVENTVYPGQQTFSAGINVNF